MPGPHAYIVSAELTEPSSPSTHVLICEPEIKSSKKKKNQSIKFNFLRKQNKIAETSRC